MGLANAGHLAFSSLCALTDARGMDLVEIATEHEVSNVEFASSLWDGCEPGQLDPARGWEIINHASSAVLEEILHCSGDPSAFSGVESRFAAVGEYRQDIP